MSIEIKDPTNPKQAFANTKVPLGLVPLSFITQTALGLMEGMLKYGKANFRGTKVYASTYIDALDRHIEKWVEGEECDPDTQVPHLGNAAACLAILVDAKLNGTLIDDRPKSNHGAIAYLNGKAAEIANHLRKLFKDHNPKHYTISDNEPEIKGNLWDKSVNIRLFPNGGFVERDNSFVFGELTKEFTIKKHYDDRSPPLSGYAAARGDVICNLKITGGVVSADGTSGAKIEPRQKYVVDRKRALFHYIGGDADL